MVCKTNSFGQNIIIFRLRHYNCYHGQDTGHSDYFTKSQVQLEVVTQEASRATSRTTDVPGTDALHLVNSSFTLQEKFIKSYHKLSLHRDID